MIFFFLSFLLCFAPPAAADIENVRLPVAAGIYYPQNPAALKREGRKNLSSVPRKKPEATRFPKVLLVPESPLAQAGKTTAVAYDAVARLKPFVKRVVLIGATDKSYFGTAVSNAAYWDIPGARFKIDTATNALLAQIAGTGYDAARHLKETALEQQLPFIAAVFNDDVSLVPILTGDAHVDQIADILQAVWGGPETLIVVVSDLSSGRTESETEKKDRETAVKIETADENALTEGDARALLPIKALLRHAAQNDMTVERLALSNSAQTTGEPLNVTGFGAWGFYENVRDPEEIKKSLESTVRAHQETLLKLAAASVLNGFRAGRPLKIRKDDFPPELLQTGPVFVHLYHNGVLRGSAGAVDSKASMAENVAKYAYEAAFQDYRYLPLEKSDLKDVEITLSFLMPKIPVKPPAGESPEASLRPNIDGLLLREHANAGYFLPSVWEVYPDPRAFLEQLKRKAGLPPDYASPTLKLYRFEVLDISSGDLEFPESVWQ